MLTFAKNTPEAAGNVVSFADTTCGMRGAILKRVVLMKDGCLCPLSEVDGPLAQKWWSLKLYSC